MRELLRERQLLAYLAGNVLSIIGTWAQRVVIFWMAWEITGSSSIIGVLAALDLLPSVVAAPIAGIMADRRPAMLLARNLQFLSALPPLITLPFLLTGHVGVPVLMALSLATGILNGFDHPLRLLLVGSIVSRERVSAAVAVNSMMFNLGRLIGPVLGGWAVASGWSATVFVYNALSYVVFAVIFIVLGARRSAPAAARDLGAALLGGGVASFFRRIMPQVGPIYLLFAAIALLIRPVFELLPAFTEGLSTADLLPAEAFSLMTSALGLGAMCGAFGIALFVQRFGPDILATATGAVAVLALLTFLAVSRLDWAVVVLAVLAGATLMNSISTQIAMQTRLPENIRGRALALYTMTFRGLPALGAMCFGALAELASVRISFAVSAAMIAVLLGIHCRALMRG